MKSVSAVRSFRFPFIYLFVSVALHSNDQNIIPYENRECHKKKKRYPSIQSSMYRAQSICQLWFNIQKENEQNERKRRKKRKTHKYSTAEGSLSTLDAR